MPGSARHCVCGRVPLAHGFRQPRLPRGGGRAGRLADADMTLAEEALLTGDTQQAIKMARRTLSYENLRDELQNRANDILFRYGAAAK